MAGALVIMAAVSRQLAQRAGGDRAGRGSDAARASSTARCRAAATTRSARWRGWSSRIAQADEQVGTLGVFVRNLVFYSGIKTTDVITDEQARDFLSQSERVLMVVPAETIDRLEREQGVKVRRLAELLYFNEAGVRVRTLLGPDVARDLTRVVLVSNR